MTINITGGQTSDVRYAVGSIDHPRGLDCKEIENYGAASEVEGYRLNRDGACDYEDIGDPAEIEAYKVFGGYNAKSKYQGKEQRAFKQFRGAMQGSGGGANIGFSENEIAFRKIMRA